MPLRSIERVSHGRGRARPEGMGDDGRGDPEAGPLTQGVVSGGIHGDLGEEDLLATDSLVERIVGVAVSVAAVKGRAIIGDQRKPSLMRFGRSGLEMK